MTRKSKNSRKSLQLSSKHDYNFDNTSPSQSFYESDEDYNNSEPPLNISDSAANSTPNTDQLSLTSRVETRPDNTYINVAPLPIFHGNPNECCISHVSRFIKVCRANNVFSTDTMTRIFAVTLENEAALWYDLNIEPYPTLTWEEIKVSFLEAYHRVEVVEQLKSDLMSLNQGDEECVRSYFLRLQWILKRWEGHGLSDSILKGVFVEGLRGCYKEWVIPQRPECLNEALRLAFYVEQVMSVRGGKSVRCGFCGGLHEERRCVVREKMRGLFRRSQEKKRVMMGSLEIGDESEEVVKSGEDKSEGIGKSLRRCQCSKHQCGVKKFEGSNSVKTRDSAVE